MSITRIAVARNGQERGFKIINLETAEPIADPSGLYSLFADGIKEGVVLRMPEGNFREIMHHNGVIDPEQSMIIELCAGRGIEVEAVKVGHRYYGDTAHLDSQYFNKVVHVAFTEEPTLTTLKPRGVREDMQYYNLTSMTDDELGQLSKDRQLHLSLPQMQKLVVFQRKLGLSQVTDVYLETFAAFWSDHCFHALWKSLGLLHELQTATKEIGSYNLVSAFEDNAGVWDFYDGLCTLFKLETHNSPTQSEPYGGQLTKLGGVIRDILECGLGAKPIGNMEMTVVGEFAGKRYPELVGTTLAPARMAQETIRAVAGYGNPMGIPMLQARMMSHPDFGAKPFALGGTIGITTRAAANKRTPHKGDLAVLVGGRTGNDGLHGATVSSAGITEQTDTGDSTHVQIGLPYTEQLMMRAGIELRDAGCCSARNDFGAAGIVSCFGEMGKTTGGVGGIRINLALTPLKCDGMGNWKIALSESQERVGHAVKPEKWDEAQAIYAKYGLEATVIGTFTENGRFQMVYDADGGMTCLQDGAELSGEVCCDVPYTFLEDCPLPEIEVVEPWHANVEKMGLMVVGHFDVCDQSMATQQYDSTVQGITYQGPLYGRHHNITSSLGILCPVFGKPYGTTVSMSFSPWQFEVDPVNAAAGALFDVVATQVVAGVELGDIALADNFYTDGQSGRSLWYLREQVRILARLSRLLGTPFITGKDSSSGRGTFGGVTVKVPPSVCITAMGKAPDVEHLVLHQWQGAGNKLVSLGPRTKRLDGSILSATSGTTGIALEEFDGEAMRRYLDELGKQARSGMFLSAVPVNRGGIFLRLFEGIEASGFGFDAEVSDELFPESMGSVLVEVSPQDAATLCQEFPDLNPLLVGTILPERGLSVMGTSINLELLHNAWSTSFKEKVYAS